MDLCTTKVGVQGSMGQSVVSGQWVGQQSPTSHPHTPTNSWHGRWAGGPVKLSDDSRRYVGHGNEMSRVHSFKFQVVYTLAVLWFLKQEACLLE